MNIYEFLNNKTENIKITSPNFNVIALVKAFNALESTGDKAEKVIISPCKLNELILKEKEDIFEENNIYTKIINKKEIFNVPIIVQNDIDENIIKIIGNNNIVELFIGKL